MQQESHFCPCFSINAFRWRVVSSQIHFCPYRMLSQFPQPTAGEAGCGSSPPKGTPSSRKIPQNCWGLEIPCSLGPFLFSRFSWGSPNLGTPLFLPLRVTFLPLKRVVLKDINPLAMLQILLPVVEVETNLFCVGALLF